MPSTLTEDSSAPKVLSASGRTHKADAYQKDMTELVEQYLPLVKSHVSKFHTKEHVSFEPEQTFVPSGDQLQRIKLCSRKFGIAPKNVLYGVLTIPSFVSVEMSFISHANICPSIPFDNKYELSGDIFKLVIVSR